MGYHARVVPWRKRLLTRLMVAAAFPPLLGACNSTAPADTPLSVPDTGCSEITGFTGCVASCNSQEASVVVQAQCQAGRWQCPQGKTAAANCKANSFAQPDCGPWVEGYQCLCSAPICKNKLWTCADCDGTTGTGASAGQAGAGSSTSFGGTAGNTSSAGTSNGTGISGDSGAAGDSASAGSSGAAGTTSMTEVSLEPFGTIDCPPECDTTTCYTVSADYPLPCLDAETVYYSELGVCNAAPFTYPILDTMSSSDTKCCYLWDCVQAGRPIVIDLTRRSASLVPRYDW